jgi:hypothetical protein
MPFHWCYQETEALFILLGAIPLIGLFFRRLHARFHQKWKTLCNHKDCCSDHVKTNLGGNLSEHEEYYSINDHGWGCKIVPPREWDPISIQDVYERYGGEVLDDLCLLFRENRRPYAKEFEYFICVDEKAAMLKAIYQTHSYTRVLIPNAEWETRL